MTAEFEGYYVIHELTFELPVVSCEGVAMCTAYVPAAL